MRRIPVVTFLTYNSSPTDLDCFCNQYFKEHSSYPEMFYKDNNFFSIVKTFVVFFLDDSLETL